MKWFSYTVKEYKASLLLHKWEFLRLFENREKKNRKNQPIVQLAENILRFFSSLPPRKCPDADLSEQRS
jgi:hypothetical protein